MCVICLFHLFLWRVPFFFSVTIKKKKKNLEKRSNFFLTFTNKYIQAKKFTQKQKGVGFLLLFIGLLASTSSFFFYITSFLLKLLFILLVLFKFFNKFYIFHSYFRKYNLNGKKLEKNAFNMSVSSYVTSLVDTSTANFTPDEKWDLLFNVDCSLEIPIDDFNEN